MKTSVFKLVNWINKKNKETYLFVGDYHKKIIETFNKKKSITEDEKNILKNHFQNYPLLEKTIKNDNVKIIYENIFDDDTLYTLKNKIAYHITNINFDHIYLWGSKNINNYQLIDILTNIFNSTEKLYKDEVAETLENLFKLKLITKKKIFTIHEIYEYINNNNNITINIPLELNYYDINKNQKIIQCNPFKNIKINNRFLDSNNKYNSIYKYNLDSFNIIKNKIDNNIINFTNSNDIFNAYKKKLDEDDDTIINGVVRVYFPHINDVNDYTIYNETYEQTIKKTDEIISKFISSNQEDKLENEKSVVNRLHLKIYHTIINIKFKNYLMNLESYFNNFTTTDEIPMIIYKKKNNNIYKINKNSLGNKNEISQKKIDNKDITKWTENINIIRKNEFIEFKIFFKNFNDINLSKYFNLLIFDNGRIDIVYDFKNYEYVVLKEIIESFNKINNILNEINKKFNINLINLNENVFKTNVSFIEFVDFNISNELTFNNVILSDKDIIQSLKSHYPYFDIINDKNNLIYIKFKRINNFFNIDDIQSYIEDNFSKSKSELIPLIIKKYNISKTKAEKEYDEIRDLIKLNLQNNNKIRKSNINKGVFVILKLTNQLQIKFLVKNITNRNDNNIIKRLLLYLSTNDKILKETKKISKDITYYNNFNKDAHNNFTENSDDDWNFILENSDDNDSKTINNNSNIEDSIKKKNNSDSDSDNNSDNNSNNNSNNNSDNNSNNNSDNNDNNNLFEINDDDLERLEILDDNNNDKTDNNKMDNEIEKDNDEIVIDTSTIDYMKIKKPNEIKKYNKLILKRLQAADPALFKTPYSKYCQSSNKKQPVVITEKEKKYIDEKFPGSYTTFVKTGSDDIKAEKYYYICPKYWCPLSAVSLTDKQLKKLDGKCPKKEPPIILSSSEWIKKDKDGKDIDRPRYPFLLDTLLYKNHKKIPCCKSTAPDIKVDNKKNERYIIRSKLPTNINRFSTLPDKLSKILGNKYPTDYKINENTNCFVRKGIDSEDQYVLSSLIQSIDNEKINNIDDFINIIEEKMTKIDYIELNNGNTLKLFLNPDFSIYDKKTFEYFKKDFNDNYYLDKMDLKKVNTQLKKMKEFIYDDTNEYNNDILREFMIYNSFENFKLYLRSDLFKSHEEVLQLFTNNYSWLNYKKHNIILINSKNKNREVEKLEILCSKFINYNTKINTENDFVFILKNENTYEPIVRIKNSNSKSKNDIVVHNTFSYKEDPKLKRIIDFQKKFCKTSLFKNILDPIKLYNILDQLNTETNERLDIKAFVINMSFKFVGFLLKNNLFIPVDSNILSTNIFRDNDIEIKNYIYIHNITKYQCKLSSTKIKKILKDLNKNLDKEVYKVKEVLEDNTREIAIVLDDIVNKIIPLHILSRNKDVFIEHIKDETIFLGIEDKNDTTSYINNYFDITKEYQKKLKIIVDEILSKTKTLKSISMLKHKHNPFPKNIKIDKINEIITNILEKNETIELNEEERNKLINDIYTKDLLYILRKNDSDLKVKKYEIVFSQDDILNKKLDKLNKKLSNPFKSIQNSIENHIIYTSIAVQPNKKDVIYDFITDTYKKIPEYTWRVDLLPMFEINMATEDDKDEQDTSKYLLKIFSKISKMEGKGIKIKDLDNNIDKQRENDFNDDDSENKVNFIEQQKDNIYFEKKFDALEVEEIDVNDYEQYDKIYDENYKFSFYEIEKISEITKISIIILGDFENKKLKNGHRIYDNGDKYVLFHMNSQPRYDEFNLIVKNTNKFIFEKNDLPEKFWKYIEEKK